jgi:hypothetical protein
VLDKGASVLKIQAFLLQEKLSSALYCLNQLAESLEIQTSALYCLNQLADPLEIQTSATKYIVNFNESD